MLRLRSARGRSKPAGNSRITIRRWTGPYQAKPSAISRIRSSRPPRPARPRLMPTRSTRSSANWDSDRAEQRAVWFLRSERQRRTGAAVSLRSLELLLLPLDVGDVAFDVLRRLGVGVAERLGDRAGVGLRPFGKMVVDDLEEFEAASEADVGDRDVIAANEGLALEKELVERGERLADRAGRGLLRLLLLRWRRVAGADFARILREVQRAIGRTHDIGIERAHDIEHRAVDHRALFRLGRIELVKGMLVAEILHDRAALPHHPLRQTGRFHHRRQMRRVLGEKVVGTRFAVNVVLGEVELRRAHEHPRGHVVDARLDDMKLDCRHGVFSYLVGVSSGAWLRWYGSLGDRSADRLLVDDLTRLSIASAR